MMPCRPGLKGRETGISAFWGGARESLTSSAVRVASASSRSEYSGFCELDHGLVLVLLEQLSFGRAEMIIFAVARRVPMIVMTVLTGARKCIHFVRVQQIRVQLYRGQMRD